MVQMVMAGGRMFVTARKKDDKKAAESRQKKREAEEADKVSIAPTYFRETFIEPLEGPPKQPLWRVSYCSGSISHHHSGRHKSLHHEIAGRDGDPQFALSLCLAITPLHCASHSCVNTLFWADFRFGFCALSFFV